MQMSMQENIILRREIKQEEYIIYDSFYKKFNIRQNYSSSFKEGYFTELHSKTRKR